MSRLALGTLAKMRSEAAAPVAYAMPVGDLDVAMNPLLGQRVALRFEGTILCVACGRRTNKSFNQGYCYPCFKNLAACDTCIMSPERCHFREGTCREPEWGLKHCMTDHVVYLANGTGLKVGITRAGQVPTRWIDQGAVQALPLARTATRQQAGLLESAMKAHVSDRTQWQTLLKGNPEPMDLAAARSDLLARCAAEIARLQSEFGIQAIVPAEDAEMWSFDYPVLEFPAKVRSLALEKLGEVEGELLGIKGQYLILSSGVINIRKYTGHEVELLAAV
ncbi:MAG: DUF2797 domain-containing protein [Gammaproteobacteria bacterium]|nr:DUF2797 domain-containing protein [Gammaproteobacteria bacterium]